MALYVKPPHFLPRGVPDGEWEVEAFDAAGLTEFCGTKSNASGILQARRTLFFRM